VTSSAAVFESSNAGKSIAQKVSHYQMIKNMSVDIKYSVHDLLFGVNNYA